MANIMINKVCNLQCSYCFANKFVNNEICEDSNNITKENFEKALRFITFQNPDAKVGIIGGEPTLHPHFSELVQLSLSNKTIKQVIVFTNGINLEKCKKFFEDYRFCVLINLNSPEDIGDKKYEKIKNNIRQISETSKRQISLGVNFYNPSKDYSYILKLANEIGLWQIRLSVVVPNTDEKENQHSLNYFSKFKEGLFNFFKQ